MYKYKIKHIVTGEEKELETTWKLKEKNLYEFLPLFGWWRVLKSI